MYHPIQRMTGPSLEQDMHVVWHYAPSYEPIPFAIESQKRLLDQFADFGNRQMALAVATVERSIGRVDSIRLGDPTDILEEVRGKAVCQSKYQVLHQIGCIQMRQISPRPPGDLGDSVHALICGRDARGPVKMRLKPR
jgi:hypothetical protein